MAAERDVNRRAPDGVIVRRPILSLSFTQISISGARCIAEAEYYALDVKYPSHGEEIILIDHHDLTPGQREESVFVVSNNSQNVLSAVNAFIDQTKFPLK